RSAAGLPPRRSTLRRREEKGSVAMIKPPNHLMVKLPLATIRTLGEAAHPGGDSVQDVSERALVALADAFIAYRVERRLALDEQPPRLNRLVAVKERATGLLAIFPPAGLGIEELIRAIEQSKENHG